MPRYLVERTFPEKFTIPGPSDSEQDRLRFTENNTRLSVVWIYSYVSPDRKKSYCIYDAPNPEVLRRAAQNNCLPIDRIIEIQLLDAYPYAKQENGEP